jgi:hypothetical protein
LTAAGIAELWEGEDVVHTVHALRQLAVGLTASNCPMHPGVLWRMGRGGRQRSYSECAASQLQLPSVSFWFCFSLLLLTLFVLQPQFIFSTLSIGVSSSFPFVVIESPIYWEDGENVVI